MNVGQLEDLKQFIDARISLSEARTQQQIEDLRKEMLDEFAGVGEAIEEINKKWMSAYLSLSSKFNFSYN